jgi:hypothetical protein
MSRRHSWGTCGPCTCAHTGTPGGCWCSVSTTAGGLDGGKTTRAPESSTRRPWASSEGTHCGRADSRDALGVATIAWSGELAAVSIRRSRPELALYGLTVLLLGLVVAPLVHLGVVHGGAAGHGWHHAAAHHDESVPHHHPSEEAPTEEHQHPPNSIEHLAFCAVESAAVVAPAPLILARAVAKPDAREAPAALRRHRPEQPQGP